MHIEKLKKCPFSLNNKKIYDIHSNGVVYLDENENKEKAKLSTDLILTEEYPQLIDEWNLIPKIWDAVRRKCDETTQKGKIYHSGAGE